MHRWASFEQSLSARRVKESARDLVALVANADNRRQATKEVINILSPRSLPAPEQFINVMTNALSHAINSIPNNSVNLKADNPFTAESVAQMLYDYDQILLDLQQPHAFPDIIWYWARHACLCELTLGQETPAFTPGTACMTMALTLQLSRQPRVQLWIKDWQRHIQPWVEVWQDRVLYTQVLRDMRGRLIDRIYLR